MKTASQSHVANCAAILCAWLRSLDPRACLDRTAACVTWAARDNAPSTPAMPGILWAMLPAPTTLDACGLALSLALGEAAAGLLRGAAAAACISRHVTRAVCLRLSVQVAGSTFGMGGYGGRQNSLPSARLRHSSTERVGSDPSGGSCSTTSCRPDVTFSSPMVQSNNTAFDPRPRRCASSVTLWPLKFCRSSGSMTTICSALGPVHDLSAGKRGSASVKGGPATTGEFGGRAGGSGARFASVAATFCARSMAASATLCAARCFSLNSRALLHRTQNQSPSGTESTPAQRK
mmetsp:Transcript_15290/g.47515  ORF Transcript_15290/g.47515 Transcript_15290/m.47515 type:complete len:291 (-) Transcript_15290:1409-2281(-)